MFFVLLFKFKSLFSKVAIIGRSTFMLFSCIASLWLFTFSGLGDVMAQSAAVPSVILPLVVNGVDAASTTGTNGVKVGGSRVHSVVGLITRFASNPGRIPMGSQAVSKSGEQLEFSPTGDVVLGLHTALEMLLPSPSTEYALKGEVNYLRYMGLFSPDSTGYSGFDGNLDGSIRFNKGGRFEWQLADKLVRTAQPGNMTFSARLLHTSNELTIRTKGKLGGGALQFEADYGFFYDYYDRSGSVSLVPELLDNFRHRPRAYLGWRFLPRTSIYLEGRGELTFFPIANLTADTLTGLNTGSLGVPQNENSQIYNAVLGLKGSLTRRTSLSLAAGYNALLITGGLQHGIVGRGRLTYFASSTSQLEVALSRSYQPATLFGYQLNHQLDFNYSTMLTGRMTAKMGTSLKMLIFGPGSGNSNRTDMDAIGNFALMIQLSEWLGVSITDNLTYHSSNAVSPYGPSNYLSNDFTVIVQARY